MNVLITGGLGHIGSYLIRNLPNILGTDSIYVVDSLRTQRYVSLFNLPRSTKITFHEKDVASLNSKDLNAMEPIDCVIHLAAITDASGTVGLRDELIENNFGSTKHIVSLCADLNIPIIYPSSTSVYGSQNSLVDETCTELLPQSPYAESKLMEETIVKSACAQGLKGVVLRLGTIHGTSPGMRFHTAVNRFCFQAANGLPITVWKTALHQKRPYLALEDASRAFAHVIRHNLYQGETYNLLTANHTVRQIIDAIELKLNKKCRIEFVDDKIMNQLSYEVSNHKFRKKEFEFVGSLEKDISDTLSLLSGTYNE